VGINILNIIMKEIKRKFEYRCKAVYDTLFQIRSAIRMQRNIRRMLK
jgi:hypothetical protein